MVKLTAKFINRKIAKRIQAQTKKKDDTEHLRTDKPDYLNRTTHLYLQGQFIDKIAPIPECTSVSVIYLQNNLLQSIKNLENFPSLTHLYLQHNYINKMENFNGLKSLKKLYLGYNEISVIENLDKLPFLVELHLENQRLSPGETLYFDPVTVKQLGRSLKVLNVSNNNLTIIKYLKDLTSLNKLIIENNQLNDMEDIMETISCMPMLETLESEGNPVANDRKYLDNVVVASKSVKTLNRRDIDEKTRMFITNLEYNKECRRQMSEFSTRVFQSDDSFPNSRGDVQSVQRANVRLGSKLFPALKEMSKKNQKVVKIPSVTSNGTSPIFENTIRVRHMSASGGFFY